MSDTSNLMVGIESVATGLGIEEFTDVVSRYNRLSNLLKGLQGGFDEEYLRELTVQYIGVGKVVELTECPTREDLRLKPSLGKETSTRTIINAHWGDDYSKLFVTAHQARKREGEIVGTTDYRCDKPFIDNSLRLGSVIRAAKVARGMQHRQRS